jgi:hypothetical protein
MNFPAESERQAVLCTRLLIVREPSRTYRSLKYRIRPLRLCAFALNCDRPNLLIAVLAIFALKPAKQKINAEAGKLAAVDV